MNFGTEYADGTTVFTAASMLPLLQALDKAVSYHHNMMVHCDGVVSYNKTTGVLSWSAALQVIFLASDGKAIYNATSGSGSVTLADNEFAYVDLVETDGNTLVVGKAAITTNSAANFNGVARVVLGYRNSTSDEFYPAALKSLFGASANESIVIAVSDETTNLTAAPTKVTFRMPYAFTLTEVRASVNTAPTGSNLTVDINEGGTSILSTKLTIDDGEKTSTTAATAAVISDTDLADDAEITIDIDNVGSTTPGKGLKVVLIGVQA